ncbi:hypothetical protein [Leptothoe spongobia]|uniref:Uncharacterized protein n=1 Tax=Leptothoe spongobia TAU-MAC 1115 TaxID=1967444 RepID=A0A947DH05_9CYAN|nr:hypothetical protein [Leptothoe spongobia]MBT9316229.1 hypothetical protein [Leptothoe spongobia TAU-MAC 1115]
MAQILTSRRLSLSLALLLTTIGLSLTAPVVNADFPKQTQDDVEFLVDFEEEDGLDHEKAGFNAVYIDREGNVLGTFVNVPGAKIKVYSDGRIELESRDYTTEVDYNSNGEIRSIGDARLRYFSGSNRVRAIDDIDFRYRRNGLVERIGNTEFDYSSRGRLRRIEDVRLNYDRNDILESIDDNKTQDGIRIIVVN